MAGSPRDPTATPRTKDPSMDALSAIQGIMDSEIGKELQRRMGDDEDTIKAVFEGLKDVRRQEDIILHELAGLKNLVETLRNEVRVLGGNRR